MTRRFQVASISKQFAAAGALSLVDAGVLDLREPIGRWVPEAADHWRGVTLHQLLSHTARMPHWGSGPGFDIFDGMPAEERIAHFLTSAPLAEPWRYSSPGYMVVGHVIERATGAPYTDVIGDLLPLRPRVQLPDTTIGLPPEGAVQGHRGGEPVTWHPGVFVGTNDVWSTESDIEAWTYALHTGPLGPRLTGPYTAVAPKPGAAPASDAQDAPWLKHSSYGYGLFTGSAGGRDAVFHEGDVPGFRSVVVWLPQERRAVAVLADDESADVIGELRKRVNGD